MPLSLLAWITVTQCFGVTQFILSRPQMVQNTAQLLTKSKKSQHIFSSIETEMVTSKI